MKKIKLLTPILGLATISSIIIPLTSCNKQTQTKEVTIEGSKSKQTKTGSSIFRFRFPNRPDDNISEVGVTVSSGKSVQVKTRTISVAMDKSASVEVYFDPIPTEASTTVFSFKFNYKVDGKTVENKIDGCTLTLTTEGISILTFTHNEGGIVVGQSPAIVEKNTKWSDIKNNYEVFPDEQHTFDAWYINDVKLTDDFAFVDNSYVITAKFIEKEPTTEFTITYNCTAGGSISGTTEVKLTSETSFTDTPKPILSCNEGYMFDGWYINDQKVMADTKLSSTTTITAKFVEEQVAPSDDFEFDYQGNDAIITKYNGTSTSIVIPETIEHTNSTYTVIVKDMSVFKDVEMTSIKLNNSTTSISSTTSTDLKNLAYIDMPNVTSIGDNSFAGCNNLKTIKSSKAETFGVNAFKDCGNLEEIDLSSAKTIGDAAFQNCYSLKKAEFGQNLTTISSSAFTYCPSLETISVNSSNKKFKSVDNGLYSSDELILGCKNTILPTTKTTIGVSAFEGCIGLKAIDFTNVGNIKSKSFKCSGLTSIDLKNIKIGKLADYGTEAFAYCNDLTDVNFGLVNDISIFQHNIFGGSNNIEKIEVDSENTLWTVVNNCLVNKDASSLYFGCKTSEIPDTVEKICDYAFYRNTAIKNINLNNVSEIKQYAFAECTNLESIDLSKVNGVGNYAFKSCAKLTSLNIGNSEKYINLGTGAFTLCDNLTNVKINLDNGSNNIINASCFEALPLLNKVEITGVTNSKVKIYDNAFKSCHKLSEFDFACVSNLGTSSFEDCPLIKTAIFAKDNLSIGKYAFKNCSGLETIQVNSLYMINVGCTMGCSKLTSITQTSEIPEFGYYVESNSFRQRKKVTIQSEEKIWVTVFGGCSSCDFSGVTEIKDSAFEGMDSLTSIDVKDVSEIGVRAFANCKNLVSFKTAMTTFGGWYTSCFDEHNDNFVVKVISQEALTTFKTRFPDINCVVEG